MTTRLERMGSQEPEMPTSRGSALKLVVELGGCPQVPTSEGADVLRQEGSALKAAPELTSNQAVRALEEGSGSGKVQLCRWIDLVAA